MLRLWAILALLLATSCGPKAAPHSDGDPARSNTRAKGVAPEGELKVEWRTETRSPNPRLPSFAYARLEQLCGESDRQLDDAARWLLERGPLGQDENDMDRLTFGLRAAGTPYVRPVAWSRGWEENAPPPVAALEVELRQWLDTVERGTLRRCGFAELIRGNRKQLGVIAAQALAELDVPLPTTARVGQWLRFGATLLAPADQAHVILLSPDGEPQTVPTSQQGQRIRAQFAAKSPGRWLVQLLASGDTGPRPMLEAVVYVDEPPERHYVDQAIPGQSAFASQLPAEQSLDRMVANARLETGRPLMHRDPKLDELALEQATAMRRAGRVGHDVGSGSTPERLSRAGVRARLAGENVVHAADALRVHRALWASPSHRTNLLHRGFARWGLGVTTDVDGTLWVCELFASDD